MASVTFSTTVGGDGSTVSDDTSPTTGLRNGGYLTRFVPALQQVVAVAGFVLAQATAASGSATAASASASAASMSASNAAASASSAAAAYDAFDDRWLGAKSADPTVDNDGNPLLLGAVYWNTTASETRVWTGTIWQTATINGGTIANLNVTGNTTLGDAGTDTLTVNAAATFAGSLAYTGTLTGGAGVINIGAGQIYKDATGNVHIGGASPGAKLQVTFSGKGTIFGSSGAQNAYSAWQYNGGDVGYIGNGAAVVSGAGSTDFGITAFTGGKLWLGSNNGASSAVLDTAGNLGLGVTPSNSGASGWKTFELRSVGSGLFSGGAADIRVFGGAYFDGAFKYAVSGSAVSRYEQVAGQHSWYTAPSGTAGNPITFTQAMTLTQGGALTVGSTVPDGDRLTLTTANEAGLGFPVLSTVNSNAGARQLSIFHAGSILGIVNARTGGALVLGADNAECARITSGGYFKASNTGSYGGVAGIGDQSSASNHVFQSNANTNNLLVVNSNTGSAVLNVGSYLPTGSTGFHFIGAVNGVTSYQVLANGNVQNTNNSYGAISDAKLKNIIAPRDGAHYWEKFKLIKFWIYSLISDPTNQQLLGVVAQELRDVFPGLVIETPDMHEVTKTCTVTTTRQVTEPVEQQQVKTEVVLENGRYVQKTTVEIVTLDEPVFDEYPLYDENGDRVMTLVSPEVEEQLDEDGNVIVEAQLSLYEPATHKVPRMETVESVEEYTEMEPTGEITLAVNYSILGLIADTITQELQRRMESAEQRLDLLEAA